LQWSSKNGLFALLIKNNAVESWLNITTANQKFTADFVGVIGDRVIVAATAEGDGSNITFLGTTPRSVKLSDKGVLLFDLDVATQPATGVVNTVCGSELVLKSYVGLTITAVGCSLSIGQGRVERYGRIEQVHLPRARSARVITCVSIQLLFTPSI
jgi:hypothetical protein